MTTLALPVSSKTALSRLPPLERQIYAYICRYKAQYDGLSPSVADIKDHFQLPSTSRVALALKALEAAGLIRRISPRRPGIIVTGGRWSME